MEISRHIVVLVLMYVYIILIYDMCGSCDGLCIQEIPK